MTKDIFYLSPYFEERLWGGTRLLREFGCQTKTGCMTIDAALKAKPFCGIPLTIVKKAACGTTIYHEGEKIDVPPYKGAEQDPAGVGDSWDWAFVARLSFGDDLLVAANYANAAAALSVTKKGPISSFFTSEIEKFMRNKS
jgi:sugar/nucleoside kinase (ribokinase family)